MKIDKINIKKLHIDDWVRIKSSNKLGQVSKICTYKNQDHDTVSVDGLVCASNNIGYVELTPDIIASSGATTSSKNEYMFKGKYFDLSLYYTRYPDETGLYNVIIGETCNSSGMEYDELVFGYIKYVHELQHLLDIFDVDYKINFN